MADTRRGSRDWTISPASYVTIRVDPKSVIGPLKVVEDCRTSVKTSDGRVWPKYRVVRVRSLKENM